MKIKTLYEKYDIMPQLAEHQLRVAGIGKLISDMWADKTLARESVIACLVHDMGNIVKFEGLTDTYWIGKKQEYIKRYSTEAHEATRGILLEAGLDTYSKYLDEEGTLYHDPTAETQFSSVSRQALIVLYGDMRVALTGVVSLHERIIDLQKRYPGSDRPETRWGDKLEEYIQSLTSVDVKSISENDVRPFFDEFLKLDIST